MFCISHIVVSKCVFWLQTQHHSSCTALPQSRPLPSQGTSHPSQHRQHGLQFSVVPLWFSAQTLGCVCNRLSGTGGKLYKEASGKTCAVFFHRVSRRELQHPGHKGNVFPCLPLCLAVCSHCSPSHTFTAFPLSVHGCRLTSGT